jgi:mRNA interferase MazF
MKDIYIPEAGDIISFSSREEHDRTTSLPLALVVSPSDYNSKTGLMLCCPITFEINNYPFEVYICGQINGAVLADHIKSLDWSFKAASRFSSVSESELREVRAKIRALI